MNFLKSGAKLGFWPPLTFGAHEAPDLKYFVKFNCTSGIISEVGSIDEKWQFTSVMMNNSKMMSQYFELLNHAQHLGIQDFLIAPTNQIIVGFTYRFILEKGF